jgi:hypothetical protein
MDATSGRKGNGDSGAGGGDSSRLRRARMRQAILLLEATARMDAADEAIAAGDKVTALQLIAEAEDMINQARKLAERAGAH